MQPSWIICFYILSFTPWYKREFVRIWFWRLIAPLKAHWHHCAPNGVNCLRGDLRVSARLLQQLAHKTLTHPASPRGGGLTSIPLEALTWIQMKIFKDAGIFLARLQLCTQRIAGAESVGVVGVRFQRVNCDRFKNMMIFDMLAHFH